MPAKPTAKGSPDPLKAVKQAVGQVERFEVDAHEGHVVLTPVRIQAGDAVRANLAAIDLTDADAADAVRWVRSK